MDREIRKLKEGRKREEKLEEVRKELKIIKKELIENNKKMEENMKDISSLGQGKQRGEGL